MVELYKREFTTCENEPSQVSVVPPGALVFLRSRTICSGLGTCDQDVGPTDKTDDKNLVFLQLSLQVTIEANLF